MHGPSEAGERKKHQSPGLPRSVEEAGETVGPQAAEAGPGLPSLPTPGELHLHPGTRQALHTPTFAAGSGDLCLESQCGERDKFCSPGGPQEKGLCDQQGLAPHDCFRKW